MPKGGTTPAWSIFSWNLLSSSWDIHSKIKNLKKQRYLYSNPFLSRKVKDRAKMIHSGTSIQIFLPSLFLEVFAQISL